MTMQAIGKSLTFSFYRYAERDTATDGSVLKPPA